MKGKSKDYINGFKHGVYWCLIMRDVETDENKIIKSLEEAMQSLKEGR